MAAGAAASTFLAAASISTINLDNGVWGDNHSQLTFWINLWLITFELHSREHFFLGVTSIFLFFKVERTFLF